MKGTSVREHGAFRGEVSREADVQRGVIDLDVTVGALIGFRDG